MSSEPTCPYCRAPIEVVGARCAACGLTEWVAPDGPPPPAPGIPPMVSPPPVPPPVPPPSWYWPPPPPPSSNRTALVVTVVAVIGFLALCTAAVAAVAVLGSPDPTGTGDEELVAFDERLIDRPLLRGDTVHLISETHVGAVERGTHVSRWWTPLCAGGTWADPTRQTAEDVLVVRCGGELTGVSAVDGERLWTVDIGGLAHDLQVSGSTLAISFADRVTVRDLTTGRIRWERTGLGRGGHPVAMDRVRVYVADGASLDAYDAQDGRPLWRAGVEVGSMAVDGPAVYVRERGTEMGAVDTATGAVLWRSAPTRDVLGPALVIGVTGGHVVLGDASAVLGFSLATQRIAWRIPDGRGFAAEGSVVTASDGGLRVTDAFRGVTLLNDPAAFAEFPPVFDADGIVYVDGFDVIEIDLPR